MTAGEFAFLALGLVLGAAGGAALVMVLGNRPAAREVRVTVSHDAVPRRGATLSSDAFVTSPAEPARGGPADRRRLDRGDESSGAPDFGPMGREAPLNPALGGFGSRTSVSFGGSSTAPVGISIEPERDPALDAIRIQAARAAAQMFRADLPTATALLERRNPPPMTVGVLAPALSEPAWSGSVAVEPIDHTPALTRILGGDHHALVAVASALAGVHVDQRQSWEDAVRDMTAAILDATIAEGCLDFPVGNPFWDTFTIDQCRAIAGALAAAGYRFDGIDGWAGGRIPNYRDLTIAVAGAGLEPRRIRAWPTQEEIESLYCDVAAAADEYLTTHAPMLSVAGLQELVGVGGPERTRLWFDWDRVRAVLTTPVSTV